ncbi:MAG: hypothetical protein AAFN74_16180 [Myxococcota bacterium]
MTTVNAVNDTQTLTYIMMPPCDSVLKISHTVRRTLAPALRVSQQSWRDRRTNSSTAGRAIKTTEFDEDQAEAKAIAGPENHAVDPEGLRWPG